MIEDRSQWVEDLFYTQEVLDRNSDTKVNSQLLAPVSLVFRYTILKHIHTQ